MAIAGAEHPFRRLARSLGEAGNRKRWGELVKPEARSAYRAMFMRLRRAGVPAPEARIKAKREVGA